VLRLPNTLVARWKSLLHLAEEILFCCSGFHLHSKKRPTKMPHRAESFIQFERAQGMAGSGSAYNSDISMSNSAQDIHECPESNVPLKKRKKHLDFLRRNQGVDETPSESRRGQPCHISPVSSSSIGSVVNVDEQHLEETMSISSTKTTLLSTANLELSTSLTDSYDIKQAQALPETAKIKRSIDIGSSPESSMLVVTHLPTILHNALKQQEFASVLQWLPNGEAWKVLRWDGLRREILPKFFPHLCDDEGKEYGSIDAFLLHLSSWGFEEIQDGSEVGAYRHLVSAMR
jgi:hypothetical protein